jgi:hypothetical protein
MKEHARKFIGPNGKMAGKPFRDIPTVADPPEVIERIASCTSIFDEPEYPGKAILDAHTELAQHYDRLRYQLELEQAQQDRKLLSMEARMAEVQRRAKMRHVNFSRELFTARKMLERAQAGGRKEPQAAVRLVETLEYRLDYRPDLEEAA